MSSSSLLILFVLMIALAGFCNWVRLSLLCLKPAQLKKLFYNRREREDKPGRLREAEGILISVLFAANASKVAAPLVMFVWLGRAASEMPAGWRAVLAFAASVVSILLFAEGLPRALVNSRRQPRLGFALVPLSLLNLALYPVRWAFHRISLLIARLLRRDADSLSLWPARAADTAVWDAEGKESQLEHDEKVLISSIVDMSDTIVREIMVPRMDIHCLEQNKSLAQVRREILRTGHSRFPVYADKLDNIVGLFLAKDLLKHSSREDLAGAKVKDVMHPITFVPESKNVSELLREFQQTRRHIAVVVDEYGDTAGLVTIEDLLEEIVGEIKDEFDHEEKLFVETKDGGYIVDAKMSMGDVAEELGIELPENSEYDTIGGFVVTSLGKVPQQGESFRSNGVTVTVLEADDRRVHRVKLVPSADDQAGPAAKRGGEK